jgi:hypothetical protein
MMKKDVTTNVLFEKGGTHMSKALLILVLVLACSIQVFGLGSDHPLNQPVNLDKAPSGVNELINNTNRVHGFFVNADDRFFFAGDSSTFAAFLKQYAALKDIAGHRLIIHKEKGLAKSPWDDGGGEPCDWMLDVTPVSWREGHADKVFRDKNGSPPKEGEKDYLVELHVWTKGNVNIKKITVPKGILVVHNKEKSKKTRTPNK